MAPLDSLCHRNGLGRYWIVGWTLALSLAGALSAQEEIGWSQAAHLQFNAAHDTFQRAPASRAQRIGLAVTLLNVQPRTTANRERAKTLLKEVIAEGVVDQHTQAAHYLLGRVAYAHETKAEIQTARMHFDATREGDAESPYARLAIAQLILLSLKLDRPISDRIGLAEKYVAGLPAGGIRAAVYWILAQALMDAQASLPQALRFIELALEDGLATSAARADALVAATLLSAELDATVVSNWRDVFLQEFPRDPRAIFLRSNTKQSP